MKNLILASNNAHKVKEIKQILTDYNILTLKEVNFTEDIIEDGDSFEENALIKARTIAKYSGKAAIADDSGLSVDKLNGRPGVYSARYSPEQTDRGECEGEIIFEKRGTNGFGYDPIFYVPELNKTFAEISSDEKNAISHRKKSLEKFAKFLKEQDNEN